MCECFGHIFVSGFSNISWNWSLVYFYEDNNMSSFFLIPLNKICPQRSTLFFLEVVHEKKTEAGSPYM
jgi:hypothetical protein